MLVPMLNLFDGVLVLLRRLHRDVGRVTILTLVNVWVEQKRNPKGTDPPILLLLKSIRVFMVEVEDDEEYVKQCIDQVDTFLNKAGLTLVHRHIYPFFEALVNQLNQRLNLENLSRHVSRIVKQTEKWLEYAHKQYLLKLFETGCRKCHHTADSDSIATVFAMILSKMIHAYAGRVIKTYNHLRRTTSTTLAFRAAMQAYIKHQTGKSNGKEKEEGGNRGNFGDLDGDDRNDTRIVDEETIESLQAELVVTISDEIETELFEIIAND
jgi:hypothetical protein